jgi:hypothetical protein
MRKFLLVMVFILLTLPKIFSQDKNHTVYADLFPIGNGILSGGAGLGIGYDYALGQYFAIGGYINFFSNFNENITYNMIIYGKYYPLKTEIGNLFIDAGFGYRRRQSDEDNIHCLIVMPHVGWEFILKNGLVLEPAFGCRYDIVTLSGDENFKFGFNIKAIVGWTF